jgi:hypothetical protein
MIQEKILLYSAIAAVEFVFAFVVVAAVWAQRGIRADYKAIGLTALAVAATIIAVEILWAESAH